MGYHPSGTNELPAEAPSAGSSEDQEIILPELEKRVLGLWTMSTSHNSPRLMVGHASGSASSSAGNQGNSDAIKHIYSSRTEEERQEFECSVEDLHKDRKQDDAPKSKLAKLLGHAMATRLMRALAEMRGTKK